METRLNRSDMAGLLINEMPESLRNSLQNEFTRIPLPKYDTDGVFKSYLQPKFGFGLPRREQSYER